MLRGRHIASEDGFTLMELTVSILVILLGVLGTLTLIDRANGSTGATRTREAGTALARELGETTQGMAMTSVTQSTLATQLQTHGFPDDRTGVAGWQVVRRDNVTFNVTVMVCAVDDPSDGLGPHPSGGGFCADSGAGSGDGAAEDYKRVSFTIVPATGGPSITHTTVVGATRTANTSGSGGGGGGAGTGLNVTTLDITSPNATWLAATNGQISQTCWQPVSCAQPPADTSTSVQPKLVRFVATMSSTAQKVRFTRDGQTVATITGPGTSFTYDWNLLDTQPDGTYTIAAQAVDSSGNVTQGEPKVRTVIVNRYRPTGVGYTPASAGRNHLFSLVPEVEWYPATTAGARVDRDIIGYDVWRYPNGALGARAGLVMGTSTRWYVDTAYPTGKTSIQYRVWPSDYDPGGAVRAGTASDFSLNVMLANTRPVAPTALTASRSGTQVTLNWTQSTTGGAQPNKGDADASDCVDFYRIYSKPAGDASAWVYANRVDRTPFGNAIAPCGVAGEASNSFTLLETSSTAKQYRITAVDKKLSESTLVTPTNCATTC
jgi:hypothetical protein